ncbi:T9SS type A sorting domain-containing protein [Polaribacter sp. R2A056_3_33]|uniref:T9SS type A sorting domain-containing protein n=1 Tax=Polaribacter sp. R2A056_3_33 TaxID=2745563 RepID=UPI001C4E4224|nr:T9SS type A sorting domain-containing protein [Polaribacter sp. R2A056_3_33]QXP69702.1 T9SS type A sorting domain-containing protein [Polaribacter sp. R2A056_3_33]
MKKITLLFLFFCSLSAFSQVKLTSSTKEYNNGTTWDLRNKTTYTYDANENLISEKYYDRNNSSSSWTYSSNDSFVYNSENKVVSDTYESFDYSGNVSYGYKANYTYNANNQIVESINLEFKDGVYVDDYKNIYTYSGNKIIEVVDYYWNGSAWVLTADYSSKSTVNYGANGLVSEFYYYEWNGSAWSLDGKDVYGYNANNKLTSSIYYDWNGAAYEANYKDEYGYDANGNLILEKWSDYNNGSFELYSEENYTFDVTQMMSSFTHPFKDKFGFEALTGQGNRFVNKVLGYSNVDYRTTHNYGEVTASVKDFSSIDFAVFPNPTSSILKIDDTRFTLRNIELFNVLGKKVFVSTKNEINIAHLVNGVYLLKIESEKGNVVTKRIIKN